MCDESNTIPERTCTTCGRTFPATTEYFNKRQGGLYGLHAWCRDCRAAKRSLKKRGYTTAEQAALLSAAAPSDGEPEWPHAGRSEGSLQAPLLLALATGLRRGELLGLRLQDVDLAAGRVHVRQALRKDRQGKTVVGPCKTHRSRRSIVLPAAAVEVLAAYKGRRPKLRSDLFFVSMEMRPFTLDGFESSWKKVQARAAALMVRDAEALHDPYASEAGAALAAARFHDLRHTHATELLRAGVHVKVVAERLGDSEATVLRVYSHVLPDIQESAALIMEPMMRGLLGK